MNQNEREVMETDILIIGGGCAGLSAALHLQNKIKSYNAKIQKENQTATQISEPMITVLEKGSEIGSHSLSGAVLNPVALKELIPNYLSENCPIEAEVSDESVYYLSQNMSFKLPFIPPPFKNHGNYIISLSKFNRWLGKKIEEQGVNVFPGFAAVAPLIEDGRLVGVQTGDKGLDKDGKKKSNYEPGLLLRSKMIIFSEGSRGSLFKHVSNLFSLRHNCNEEVFEHGVKEIIQLPPGRVKPGQVIHTMGFPLSKTIGGTFIYTLQQDQIVIGLVGYLDTIDPLFDPHRELQKLKTHPFISKLLVGGKVIGYGGKTLPAGGWYSMPKLYGPGFVVCGDSASMVDVKRLKGIHLAMKSGMLAAETAFEAILKDDFSTSTLCLYEEKVNHSYIKDQLFETRNFHQTLSKGFLASLPLIGLQELTGGRGLMDPMTIDLPDAKTTQTLLDIWGASGLNDEKNILPKPDGVLFFDKLSSVYLTGTLHDENSPGHLLIGDFDICRKKCVPEYASPCNHFCPAQVYETVEDEKGQTNLRINYTNCIHCKACDIKCPFENITWTPPEGGGGPKYQIT